MKDGLLSVDVEAAIRKLTESQLSRAAMKPIELSRALMGAGAESLEIRRSARELVIAAPGAQVSAELIELLVLTLSPDRSPAQRYSALLSLEERGGLIWLALGTDLGFQMEFDDGPNRWRLEVGPRTRVLRSEKRDSGCCCVARLQLRTKGRGELELLTEHLRYSRRPVTLDGERVDEAPAHTGGALEGDLHDSRFEGRVRLLVDEDYSCIRWIDCEVLRAERYSQPAGGVAHDAVIHSRDPSCQEEAILRVRDFREGTMARLSRVFDGLPEHERTLARRLLFARAIERHDVAILGQARVFPTAGASSLTVQDLRERARRAPIEVAGLESRAGVSPHALRLDAAGRRLVTEILGVPIVGHVPFGEGNTFERLKRVAREHWTDGSERIRGLWARLIRGRRIASDLLTPEENAFRRRLQELLESGAYRIPQLEPRASRAARVQFVPRGPLPLRPLPGREPRLQLPRSHPVVQRVLRAHQRDPSTIYPALDLLFAGRDGWGSRRSQWRRAWLGSL